MTQPRTFPTLTKAPLSFVLCQVRFSPVPKMDEAMIGEIFSRLRKAGFPDDVSGDIKQVMLYPGMPPQEITAKIQEYRSADGAWAVNVARDQIVLFTTNYIEYEEFWTKLRTAIDIASEVAELKLSLTKRIGFRMIDIINPSGSTSWRDYLKPHFAGLSSKLFIEGSQLVYLESVAKTGQGVFAFKVSQNNTGAMIPPDIMIRMPMPDKHKGIKPGTAITLLDSDHFWEGNESFDIDAIGRRVKSLHHDMNAIWFDDIISPSAMAEWQ